MAAEAAAEEPATNKSKVEVMAAAKAAKAVAVAEEPATKKSKVEVMMQWKDELQLLLLLRMEAQGPGRCPRR